MCNCSQREYELIPELELLSEYIGHGNESSFLLRPQRESSNDEYETPTRPSKPPKGHVQPGDPAIVSSTAAQTFKPGPCQTRAVSVIPKYLEPKLIGCLNAIVPGVQTEYLFRKTLEANPGPSWIKKLNTDVRTLLSFLYPNVNLTIELWRVVTIPKGHMRSFLEPLSRYLDLKGNKYRVSVIAGFGSQKAIENLFKVWLDPVVTKGGALPKPPYSYYWHVYATFPDSVKNNFRQVEWVNVDKFDFNKYEIKPEQKKLINKVAIDIVESWMSSSRARYEGVTLEGHTDIRGTESNNMVLGKNRAAAAANALKDEITRIAPGYYMDPTKMKIKYNIVSLGKTRPVSKKPPIEHELNRRVEIKLNAVAVPPLQPIDLDAIILRCQRVVRSQPSLDKETAKRLHCLLTTMQNPRVDDRYIAGGQAILNIYNGSAGNPKADDWSKVRFQLTQSSLFGPQLSSAQVLRALISVDDGIRSAIGEIDRITKYNSGIPMAGAVASTPLVPILNWVKNQAKNKNSIYYCYR